MAPPARLDAPTRKLLLLVCVIVLVDTSFYAAITPLLPYYAEKLELTKASAGVLTGAYAAGTMLASLPTAWLASRIGGRRTLAFGLVLLAVSSFTFGVAQELWLLDTARFVQGVGGAATWASGLSLLTATAPEGRRAEVLGTAFAAAIAGALLGPLVGALARTVGTALAFGAVAAVAAGLLVVTLRYDVTSIARDRREPASTFGAAFRQREIRRGAALVGIAGLAFGVLDVLLPLEMGTLGASAGAIAATFIAATALETAASRPLGRLADRAPVERLALAALTATAALSLVASLPNHVAGLVAVGIAAGPLIGSLWIPGLAWLATGAERGAVAYAYAFGIQNLLWAGAQAVGAGAGGALARATSDFTPYAFVAAAAVTTAVAIVRSREPVRAG